MRRIALALAALVLTACGTRRPPNVVLIVMDTTRGDHCSVNGYGRPTTPCLEELAKESVVYENAWSPAGWTGPAHASLFTGLRPQHHGFHRSNRHFLLPSQRTLAERLGEAGYRTAAFTNNESVCTENGLDQGFQTFEPMYLDADRAYPWAVETHERALEWAVRQSAEGAPFFLFINDMEPHLQYTPPPEFQSRFVSPQVSPNDLRLARETDAAQLFAHNAGVRRIPNRGRDVLASLYDAEIATLDHSVGALMDGLRKAGLMDDTIVVVTSDHGENLGDHGLFDHMFSIHRSIRHVPLVIRYPRGRVAPGRVPQVVRLEDVQPTILEVCGLAPATKSDGASLLHDLDGRVSIGLVDAPQELLDRQAEEQPGLDVSRLRVNHRGVFDGRYHLIRSSDGRDELYDVVADPGEWNDLASEHPELADRLRPLLPPF